MNNANVFAIYNSKRTAFITETFVQSPRCVL